MKPVVRFIFLTIAVALAKAEKPVNTTLLGVAIKGYDPVAYFTAGKPVKGDAKFTYEWSGAVWRFASAEDRDTFKDAPEKYAPQFGGYCAWAVSQNYTAGSDPENAWRIVRSAAVVGIGRGCATGGTLVCAPRPKLDIGEPIHGQACGCRRMWRRACCRRRSPIL